MIAMLLYLLLCASVGAAVSVSTPITYSVYQRGSDMQATVIVAASCAPGAQSATLDATVISNGWSGANVTGAALSVTGSAVSGSVALTNGGWYRVDVIVAYTNGTTETGTVARVGVGEVFLTAGQSNAGNWGTPAQTNTEDRLAMMNYVNNTWAVLDDPISGATGVNGTPWTPFGTGLVAVLGVPVGIIGVAVHSTCIGEWAVTNAVVYRFRDAIASTLTNRMTKGVRAILWHQGESDAIARTDTGTYSNDLTAMVEGTAAITNVPWLIAEASYHFQAIQPYTTNIVLAQRGVAEAMTNVFPGSHMDNYTTGYRSDGVHCNQAGLTLHGGQWVAAVTSAFASAYWPTETEDTNAPSVEAGVVVVIY